MQNEIPKPNFKHSYLGCPVLHVVKLVYILFRDFMFSDTTSSKEFFYKSNKKITK